MKKPFGWLILFIFLVNSSFTFNPSNNSFSIPIEIFRNVYRDGYLEEDEKRLLYENYYEKLPPLTVGGFSYFGSDGLSMMELKYYGEVLRAQIQRGYVLVGSGDYGYHDNLKEDLDIFIKTWYPYMNEKDILLSSEASPLFDYLADGGVERRNRDKRRQPIPVNYNELNNEQKRIFDLTKISPSSRILLENISVQQSLGEEKSLSSGKYVSFVSSKSPNDIGRRFLFYGITNEFEYDFVGVVLVVGTASRADWTGWGSVSSSHTSWREVPLGVAKVNGYSWTFDIPEELYKYLLENKISGILAIEP